MTNQTSPTIKTFIGGNFQRNLHKINPCLQYTFLSQFIMSRWRDLDIKVNINLLLNARGLNRCSNSSRERNSSGNLTAIRAERSSSEISKLEDRELKA
ncbi:hypothetical protein CDAR_49381 [Caerostris darwini]|uniref:Uncharacterized protein n=1 Tax=Caerostris darwini TaxID=1538125 RepID=A0AAV4QC09_9ARAC|nr:hypothetical protein CDAR_49381 [Caerostris darwini]